MHRRLFLSILLLVACQSANPLTTTEPNSTSQPATETPPPDTPTPYPTPRPDFTVKIHPEEGIYIGEWVSFEVFSQSDIDASNYEVNIQINSDPPLDTTKSFSEFGIGQRYQATFRWVWDTANLEPDEYTITFTILPDGPSWEKSLTLYPTSQLQPAFQDTSLTHTETDCCLLYYLTNTAAARDIIEIETVADRAADEITTLMGIELKEPITIFLMPRVLGHGGFASSELYISYLDRNYVDFDLYMVFKHEIVHQIDTQKDAQHRPTILLEGMAVYLSGGHFKPEPLMPRAAALLELGLYIPLSTLTKDFYIHQHETGYLEAASMIEFMVQTWGIEAVNYFYLNIPTPENNDSVQAIDAGLQENFDVTFQEFEDLFISALQDIPPDPAMTADIQLSINFFDTLRAYQQTLDSSAYFRNAWLILMDDLEEKPIYADLLRHPSQPANITLETMLISTNRSIIEGNYQDAQNILEIINLVLDQINTYQPDPFNIHPLAKDYYDIVQLAQINGYQISQISLNDNQATLLVNTEYGTQLFTIKLKQQEQGIWILDE